MSKHYHIRDLRARVVKKDSLVALSSEEASSLVGRSYLTPVERVYLREIDRDLDEKGDDVESSIPLIDQKPVNLGREIRITQQLMGNENELDEDYRASCEEILHKNGMHLVEDIVDPDEIYVDE